MNSQLDSTCKNYNFCKRNIELKILNELFLNIGNRTQGAIFSCEKCNMYVGKNE